MRATLVHGVIDRDRVPEAARAVREELAPGFLSRPGARHAYWMVHPSSGRLWILTVWQDRDHLEAAAASEASLRASVADRLGARTLGVHDLEVVGAHEEDVDQAPRVRWVRATWVSGLPADRRGHLPELFNEAVPEQARTAGFCASYWLVDPEAGSGLGLSFWEGPAEVRHSEKAGRRRMRRIETALGCAVTGVRELQAIGVASAIEPAGVPHMYQPNRSSSALIDRVGTEIRRPPGTLLAVPGEPAGQVIIMLDGEAATFDDGTRVSRLVAGDHFGGRRLRTRHRHARTVMTTSPATLEVISKQEFSTLSFDRPDLAARLLEDDAEP